MTDTLIEQLQHEVDRLEAHKLHDPKRLNADALGQIAGLNTAIAIIRQHQAKQPEERGAQNATGAQETGAARTAASNTLNQIIACPMCKRDTPCSYWQGWNQNIDCKGCGFHSSGPILGEPPNVVRSEIPDNDLLDTVLKEPGECFLRTLRQHISAISRDNVMCSARDVWRILDVLLPLVQRKPEAQPSEISVGFDEWCASIKDCGHEVQPNSATARQRKLGWDAAMTTKREVVKLPTKESTYHINLKQDLAGMKASGVAFTDYLKRRQCDYMELLLSLIEGQK